MEQAVETSISLDNRGRILIPSALRQRLGLLPGMHLVVEPGEEESVCLRIESNLPKLVDKEGVLVVVSQTPVDPSAETIGDWTEITRRERDRRILITITTHNNL